MSYKVLLTESAVYDLEELEEYIYEHDSPEKAEYVVSKIEETLASLTELPNKGAIPEELALLGIKEYRQTLFKPYRIIYRVQEDTVHVYLIVDGRRNMQRLLARRLLNQ